MTYVCHFSAGCGGACEGKRQPSMTGFRTEERVQYSDFALNGKEYSNETFF